MCFRGRFKLQIRSNQAKLGRSNKQIWHHRSRVRHHRRRRSLPTTHTLSPDAPHGQVHLGTVTSLPPPPSIFKARRCRSRHPRRRHRPCHHLGRHLICIRPFRPNLQFKSTPKTHVVFGWRALRPPRVVFVVAVCLVMHSLTSGKTQFSTATATLNENIPGNDLWREGRHRRPLFSLHGPSSRVSEVSACLSDRFGARPRSR